MENDVKKARPKDVYTWSLSTIYHEADGVIKNKAYYESIYRIFEVRLGNAAHRLVPHIVSSKDELLRRPTSLYDAWFRIITVSQLDDDMIRMYGEVALAEYRTSGLRSFLHSGQHDDACERLRAVQQAVSDTSTAAHITQR